MSTKMNSHMSQYPFYWVDAFTSKKMAGNPCAVILDADALTPATMQSVAREINLSETAFVRTSTKADFGARYFTPEGELPFAGHPTIATVHALIEAGRIKPERPSSKVSLELPAGMIFVDVVAEGARRKITMSQLAPKFMRTYDSKEICAIYGLSIHDLLPGAPIQTVSTGSPVLMIPLASHAVLRRVQIVGIDRYFKFKQGGDFLFAHHFCLEGATPKGKTFARSLGTPPHELEDPFTGSATGCMAAYLWKYGLISNPHFIAEQGHWMGRPGEAEVEVVGTPEKIVTVKVSGMAVTVAAGKLDLS